MDFVPHLRLTWRGTLPSGEIWSNSLSLVPDNSAWAALVSYSSMAEYIREHVLAANLTDDVAVDVKNYHTREATHIGSRAVLTRVTLAALDEDGHYLAPPNEVAITGGAGYDANIFPYQVARKVTLETDDDLGRIKGGWYIPAPATNGWDPDSNLWSVDNTQAVRDSVKQFLDDLENAPGLDDNSFRVVVASQGRHNRDGSLRVPKGNYDVKRVNIGRRADVQRRRANKLSEARIADAALADD